MSISEQPGRFHVKEGWEPGISHAQAHTEVCACSKPVRSLENPFQLVCLLQTPTRSQALTALLVRNKQFKNNIESWLSLQMFWAVFSSSPGATLSSCIHQQSWSVKVIVICSFKFFIKKIFRVLYKNFSRFFASADDMIRMRRYSWLHF